MSFPAHLTHLFWEYNPADLSWKADRHLIIGKILAYGTAADIHWLRGAMPDAALRRWILRVRGRGLTPEQIRHWQLELDLPGSDVEAWLSDPARQVWYRRTDGGVAGRRAV